MKTWLKKLIVPILLISLLVPAGALATENSRSNRKPKIERVKGLVQRNPRHRKAFRELKALRQEIREKAVILREGRKELRAALQDKEVSPEIKEMLKEARFHAGKARGYLREVKEILRSLKAEWASRQNQVEEKRKFLPEIREKLKEVKVLLEKANHELDISILLMEKALVEVE